MRFRLQTESPLPSRKAWIAPNPVILQQSLSIQHLIAQIKDDLNLNADVSLILDGFALLSHSRVVDVVRDGDLIHVIKTEQTPLTRQNGKRIRDREDVKTVPFTRR